MAEPLNAGHVEVAVESDTTGFGQELQAKIDAAVRNVFARVATKLDARGLRGEVTRAARQASARQAVEIRARLAAERLRDDLGRFVTDAEARTRAVEVGINVDGRQVRGEVTKAVREAEAAQQIDVEVEARTTRARAELKQFRASEERDGITIPVEADRRGLGKIRPGGGIGDLLGSVKVPAAATALNVVVGALGSLAAGATAVVGSLSPVVGLLGAVPGVAVAAATGLGAVLLATSGVGDAVKALVQDQRGGTAAARSSAAADRRQEAAADRVADAKRRLADAVRNAADRQVEAERRVRDAERDLARTQDAVTDAQEDLNRARAEARERLEDLRLETARAALDEEAASLALEEARERQADVNRSVTATELERRQADLAVREAEQRLAEVRERNADLAEEYAAAERKGVDGSDAVIDARDRVADAEEAVRDAVERLADSQRDQARAQQDAARDVADAHREVARALRDVGDAGLSVDKVADTLDNLSPSARRFARVLVGYLPLLDRIKASAAEALFPRLETALHRLVRLQPTVQRALGGTSAALGDVAVEAATLVSSGPFARDIGEIAETNTGVLRSLGGALVAVVDALRHVAIAAGPMVERLADGAERIAERVRDAAAAGRESGELASFFDVAADRGGQLLRIVGNLVRGLVGVGKAGDDLGTSLLDRMDAAAERFANFTNSVGGQNRLARYFEEARPALDATIRLVNDIFRALADRATDENLAPLIEQIRTQLLPAVIDLADRATMRLGPALVDVLTAFVRLKAEIPLDPMLALMGIIADLTGALAFLLQHVPGLSTLVGTLAALAATSKGLQFASKVTGVTAFVNAISGKGNGALSNFVRGLRGADGAADTLAGRLGQRVGPAVSRLGGILRSGARAAGEMALAAGRATAAWIANAVATARAAATAVAHRVATIASTVATHAMTAAQAALNFVLALNPIGLVVLAIVALIAIFVVAYRKVDWFRAGVNAAFRAVLGVVQGVFGWVKRNWPLLLAILTGPIGLAVLAITRNWDKIKAGVAAVVSWVRDRFNAIVRVITGMPGKIAKAAAGMWDGITDAFRSAVNFIIRGWNRLEFKIPGWDPPGPGPKFGGFTLGVPDIPELALGATIRPTPGGTVVRLAEAGRAEAVVDEGLLNRRLAEMDAAAGGPRVVFEAGAIVVNNPAPEPASRSINARMRALEALGIFGADPEPVAVGG